MFDSPFPILIYSKRYIQIDLSSSITSIAYALPERRISHEDLCARFGKDVMDKIAKVSGILERRVADDNTCASDLACSAAKLIFSSGRAKPEDFDLLIFATQTPDYVMPSTSCLIQERLGIKKTCAAFDLNLGCSQFVYALATARAWIDSGMAKKALVLTGDTSTRLIHPKDRSAVSIFGDAAAACVIENTEETSASFIDFSFGTDGSGGEDLITPALGMRNNFSEKDFEEYADSEGNIRTPRNIKINGFKIFVFAYQRVSESIREILEKNSLSIDEIDLFVFHQAGEKIIKSSCSRLKIPDEKIYYKMHDIGNCGGSSIPIALADAVISGRLKPGMRVLLSSFGVGLSWNCCILNWSCQSAFTDADFSTSPTKPASQASADA